MRNHVFFDLSGAGARHFDNDASLGVERVEGPVLHVVVPEQKQEVFGVLVHTVQLTQHFALDFRVDSSRQQTDNRECNQPVCVAWSCQRGSQGQSAE